MQNSQLAGILAAMQLPLSQRHAFLSYMHEDRGYVDELQESLEAAGIQVWRDTRDLWPGEDWQGKIRAAIKADSLAFIACFSSAGEKREKSYQYEELTLAVEEYRLRRPSASWLFTVRFDECSIPEFDLGGGRLLDATIQRTDLFGAGKTVQTVRLSQAVARIMNPQGATSITTEAVANAKRASSDSRSRSETMKLLLRDSSADIVLEDFMSATASELKKQLADEQRFPTSTNDSTGVPFSELWLDQVHEYERTLEPIFDLVRLAATYGQPQHNAVWARFMRQLTSQISKSGGNKALLNLRAYPTLILMYVASIASLTRHNYSPLRGLVEEPTVRDRHNSEVAVSIAMHTNVRAVAEGVEPLASALAMSDDGTVTTTELVEGLVAKTIGNRHTPMSDHLHKLLRDLFLDELSDDRDYADKFDRAEVLLDMIATDQSKQSGRFGNFAGGYGRYTWRNRHVEAPVEAKMLAELVEKQGSWGPLVDGLFGGDVNRAVTALETVAETAARVRNQLW